MIKSFLSTRKELTEKLKLFTVDGLICRRVRETCKCHPNLKKPEMYPKANQRNAVIVFDEHEKVKHLFVRCKKCATMAKSEKL